MVERRVFLTAACITCWTAAAGTLFTEPPTKDDYRTFLLYAGMGVFIYLRTGGPGIKQIATHYYAKGLHDGVQQAGHDQAADAVHHRRRRGLALVAPLAAALVYTAGAVVITAVTADDPGPGTPQPTPTQGPEIATTPARTPMKSHPAAPTRAIPVRQSGPDSSPARSRPTPPSAVNPPTVTPRSTPNPKPSSTGRNAVEGASDPIVLPLNLQVQPALRGNEQ